MTEKKPVAAKPPKKPRGEKMIISVDKGDVYRALFNFQSDNLTLPRNGKGSVNGKTYSYVTLDDLINGIRPSLERNGLVFTQAVYGDKLITALVHAPSGTRLTPDSEIMLGKPTHMQDYGSRVTYARRYSLMALLGISAEEDIDAAGSKEVPAAAPVEVPQHSPSESITPSQSITPTPSGPTGPETGFSPSYLKARTAIETAYSIEALEMIAGQIEKSVKLDFQEKKMLTDILMNRKSIIQFDKIK